MSDKMLMENWREFLAESYSTGSPEEEEMEKMIQQAGREAELDRDFAAPRACVTLTDLIGYVEEFREADMSAAEQRRWWKNKERAMDLGTSIVGGVILGIITAPLSVPVATMIGTGATILSFIAQKENQYWIQEPSEQELANSPFLDKLDIHHVFKTAIGSKNLQVPREKWMKKVEEVVENLEAKYGDVCIKDLDDVLADKIPDINMFIQDELDLCHDEEVYQGDGALGINKFGPYGIPESKFHDNWRDFLLTEEKK